MVRHEGQSTVTSMATPPPQPEEGRGGSSTGGGVGVGLGLGSLLEKALAIDDALGAWEDKVVEKAQEKAQAKAQDIISLVASESIGAHCSPARPLRPGLSRCWALS